MSDDSGSGSSVDDDDEYPDSESEPEVCPGSDDVPLSDLELGGGGP